MPKMGHDEQSTDNTRRCRVSFLYASWQSHMQRWNHTLGPHYWTGQDSVWYT